MAMTIIRDSLYPGGMMALETLDEVVLMHMAASGDRDAWNELQRRRNAPKSDDALENKRRVRDAEYWGAPVGTPLPLPEKPADTGSIPEAMTRIFDTAWKPNQQQIARGYDIRHAEGADMEVYQQCADAVSEAVGPLIQEALDEAIPGTIMGKPYITFIVGADGSKRIGFRTAFWRADNTDEKVGHIHREINLGPPPYVDNHIFMLKPEYQDRGLARALTPRMEKLWSDLGIHQVKVVANMDVGAYAWSRFGYTFERQDEAVELVEHAILFCDTDEDRNAGQELLDRLQRGEEILPVEIAMIGYRPGAKMWPGKASLIDGPSWHGVKQI